MVPKVFMVTILLEDHAQRTYLIQADSFDEAYQHVREEHGMEIIVKIEQIMSVRDL